MRAKLGNVYGLTGPGPDNRALLVPTGRERLSQDPNCKFRYQIEERPIFRHKGAETEKQYLKEYLLTPIENAGSAIYQNDLERWAHLTEDTLIAINERLGTSPFLLGEQISEADQLLDQTLLRFDHIYYYLYKLNFAKSFDYPNIRRYEEVLAANPEIRESIDIGKQPGWPCDHRAVVCYILRNCYLIIW